MGTPATAGKSHRRIVRSWGKIDREPVDAVALGRAGRALLGVMLVSLAMWAGIIAGIRALLEAL
jgi:hypothetical protein